MFQNMGVMGDASYQLSQQKLNTLKNSVINEVIAIIEIAEMNSNRSKIPIKRINIIGQMDGLKQ